MTATEIYCFKNMQKTKKNNDLDLITLCNRECVSVCIVLKI